MIPWPNGGVYCQLSEPRTRGDDPITCWGFGKLLE